MLHARTRRPGHHHPERRLPVTRKKPAVMTLEQAGQIQLMDLRARNLTTERMRFVEQVQRRFVVFLRERHPSLGDHPPVTALSLEHAREFVPWLGGGTSANALTGNPRTRSAATVRAHLVDLKALSRFCSDEGLLPTHPLQKLRMPKVETKVLETFKAHHLDAMLRLVERQSQRERNRLLIYLLLSTGMRASELCGLTRNDVDLRSRTVKVFGKGRKERIVRFDPTTAKLVARYMAVQPDQSPGAQLFTSRYGKPFTRLALYRVIDKLGDEAKITDVRCSPHTFRHSFAVQFLRAHPGALFHLMELLGHTNLEMVRRYARLAQADANLDGPSPVEALGLDKLVRR